MSQWQAELIPMILAGQKYVEENRDMKPLICNLLCVAAICCAERNSDITMFKTLKIYAKFVRLRISYCLFA
jgi:hypothetical protein